MKVRRLEMTSFRGFRELTLEFTGPMTVLVGINGAGKTSILDCLAVLLSLVSSKLLSPKHGRRFYESDVQNGAPHTLNTVEVEFDETPIRWSLALVRKGFPRQVSNNITELTEIIETVEAGLVRGRNRLPLAIYYPINRAPAAVSHSRSKPGHRFYEFEPFDAFVEALEEGGRDFRIFFEWFRQREDLENEQRLQINSEYRDFQLQAVRTAIARFVPGFSNLRVQRAPLRMIVQKGDNTLEVDQLSDGEKGLLAMAGDIGRRLAIANPSIQDPLSGEAVVMIDEVELHLHPGWQRMVVERLQQTFPNCQFILTTHSPQVLSQVPAKSVILLDHFQRAALPAGTQGRDSNSILAEVMGVPERPQETAERIHEIARMIDREELPRARQALDELARQLGEHDSEVVRLRSLIEFLGD
ncbi:AAA family ATPase [Archangium sp.]|uniref:AAA family ATPase n=1 Tax=Archangium sp. TaxID=1872627 RepID=UPI002D55A240|nr:AAA family ATPase [Archangium sp.]HYO56276.1 AAA family ATPase [Archangium sp.]